MRILIAGAGEVGAYLAKLLNKGDNEITLIDTNQERLTNIDSHVDVLTIKGSATCIKTLKDANIKNADLFIGVMETEAINIVACSLAKEIGAAKTIARVDNPEFMSNESQKHFKQLGVDSLIYPEILASKEVVNLLQQSGAIKSFKFSGGRLSLTSFRLEENSDFIGKTLSQTAKMDNSIDYRVVAITRNGETIIPRGSDVFETHDVIYVIYNQKAINKLMEYTGKIAISIKNVMILGGSRIGKNTATTLEQSSNVKLLEIDKDKCIELADVLEKSLVINADGRNIETLLDEGLENMDAFIAVTGNTDTNILSCLFAKQYGVKRTIAEIENIEYIKLAESLGIDTVINKKRIAASHIFKFTTSAKVSDVQYITGTDAEVLEFIVPKGAKITEKELRKINFPEGAIIGGVVREHKSFIATGNFQLQTNDKVVIFILPEAIDKVAKLF